jgi:hypothetical protein
LRRRTPRSPSACHLPRRATAGQASHSSEVGPPLPLHAKPHCGCEPASGSPRIPSVHRSAKPPSINNTSRSRGRRPVCACGRPRPRWSSAQAGNRSAFPHPPVLPSAPGSDGDAGP